MKKVFLRRILFLLGAAVAMAGCGKPESEIEPDGEDTPIKITAIASTSDTPETRLGYQENESSMSFTWKDHADGKKESFSVYVQNGGDNKYTFTQIDADGANKGTFEGTVTEAEGEELYAVYPVLSGRPIVKGLSLDLSMQTLATVATDLDGNASHYLCGKAVYKGEGVVTNFNFQHLVSMLKVEMSFPAGAAAVTGVKLRGVYTEATLDATTGQLNFIGFSKGASVLYNATDIALTADRKLTTYIYLFPDDLSGKTLRLTATDVNGKTYAVDFTGRNVVAGKLYTLAQEMKDVISSELQVGDFYQNDGTVISKDAVLTDDQRAKCLGLLLKVGRDVNGTWKDDCTYMQKDGITPMPTIRGYVLAVTNMQRCLWGSDGTLVGTNTERYTGFYGYKNTQIIKDYATAKSLNLKTAFPATYWATLGYETQENGKYAAPANSSGWFLLSAGQCQYWQNNCEVLSPSLKEVIGDTFYIDTSYTAAYWSSSESDYNPAGRAWMLEMNYSPSISDVIHFGKKYIQNVRSVLAF